MPAVLTHKSIMLLARERLRQVRDELRAKIRVGQHITDLEHRIAYLAERAYEFMSESGTDGPDLDLPPNPGGRRLGDGVSRFAVMGSMGPDIPAFSGMFVRNQNWLFDTIHKGTPDEDRERVVAGTTTLALTIWSEARGLIDGGSGTDVEKQRARQALRAYVLGHLCHIAGDVISHPYVNDIEWHLANARNEKFSHSGGESAIDALVARQLLGRPSTREGQNWSVWWPTPGEVPGVFFEAYAAALETVYRADTDRPRGFTHYEERVRDGGTPELSAAFLRDGYTTYRTGALTFGYDWGYFSWFGFLTPLMVPLAASFPLLFAMPRASRLFQPVEPGIDPEEERAWFEALMLPVTALSFASVFYASWIAGITTNGAEEFFVMGIALAVLTLLAGIAFLATLGVNGADLPWWARWLILFGLPVLQSLIFAIRAGVFAAQGNAIPKWVSLIFLLPILGVIVGLIFVALKCANPEGIAYGVIAALLGVAVLALWFALPPMLRDARIPEGPAPFPSGQPHHVRLFDDASLVHDPDIREPAATDRIYPSGRRPLLRLWWSGEGQLHVRPRRTHLEFSVTGGGDPTQVVASPIDPISPAEYAARLARLVPGLHAEPAFARDEELEALLPPGAAFSDHGDDKESVSEHDTAAETWQRLGDRAGESAYLLYHAVKASQAVRFGQSGPVSSDSEESERQEGYTYVSEPRPPRLVGGEAVMDFAADFGALLCLGATTHLLDSSERNVPTLHGRSSREGASVAPGVSRVEQVFRDWNLDRRRVNEWRTLVLGGAHPDPGRLPNTAGAALRAGERVASAEGWVPLLRHWLEEAGSASANMVDEDPRVGPTRRELSRAVAYLFDMPDPLALG